jgi:hypothetical protein
MALPPLELFSLREELPCCRVALSVFKANVSHRELLTDLTTRSRRIRNAIY